MLRVFTASELILCAGCGDSATNSSSSNKGSTGVGGGECAQPAAYFRDNDGDGYEAGDELLSCDPLAGWVATSGDCDDDEEQVNPGATEVCNDRDDDCNNAIDDNASDRVTYYEDSDGDGYGDPATAEKSCVPIEGKIKQGGDCDDNYNLAYPGAPEICDERWNNCDVPWTNDRLVWFTGDDKIRKDLSADFASGTKDAPYFKIWEEDGTFEFCVGTYYVYLESRAANLTIKAQGEDKTTLSGGGVERVLYINKSNSVTHVEALGIRDGFGCYGPAVTAQGNNGKCTPTSASGGSKTLGVDLTLTEVAIENCTSQKGGSLVNLFQGSLTMINSRIAKNTGEGMVFLDDSDFVCKGSDSNTAGIWGNSGRGVELRVTDFTKSHKVTVSACDFGVGADDNKYADFRISKWPTPQGHFESEYGDDVSFSCDTTVATCTPN